MVGGALFHLKLGLQSTWEHGTKYYMYIVPWGNTKKNNLEVSRSQKLTFNSANTSKVDEPITMRLYQRQN